MITNDPQPFGTRTDYLMIGALIVLFIIACALGQ